MNKDNIDDINEKLENKIRQIIEEETSKGLNFNIAEELIQQRIQKLRTDLFSHLDSPENENREKL